MHREVDRRLKRHMVVAWGNEWVDGEKKEGFKGERKGPRRMEGRGREGVREGKVRKRELLKLEGQSSAVFMMPQMKPELVSADVGVTE